MFAKIRLEVGALSDKPPLSGLFEKKEHAEDLTLACVIGDIQSRTLAHFDFAQKVENAITG